MKQLIVSFAYKQITIAPVRGLRRHPADTKKESIMNTLLILLLFAASFYFIIPALLLWAMHRKHNFGNRTVKQIEE